MSIQIVRNEFMVRGLPHQLNRLSVEMRFEVIRIRADELVLFVRFTEFAVFNEEARCLIPV